MQLAIIDGKLVDWGTSSGAVKLDVPAARCALEIPFAFHLIHFPGVRVREGDLWILRRPVSVVLQALGSGLQRLDWRRLVCVECTDSVVVDRRQQQRPNGHTSERVVGAYRSQVNKSCLGFWMAALAG